MHRAVAPELLDDRREQPKRRNRRLLKNPSLSLLIIGGEDDQPAASELVDQVFAGRCAWRHVNNAEGAGLAGRNEHDIYLYSQDSLSSCPVEFVRSAVDAGCNRPIIVLSEGHDDGLDLKVLDAGAADCIPKAELTGGLLERSVRHALLRERAVMRASEEIAHLSAEIARLNSLRDANHRFVDDVCHDFRSPLTVVKEFASIIADGLAGDVNDEQLEFLEIILTRVDQLSQMVDAILDASRLESDLISVKREECAPADLIEQARPTLEQLAHGRGASIRFSVSDALPNVFADADSVGRIIVNLVTNACKFTGDDGEIVIWAQPSDDNSSVTIGITDNGPGIAPDRVKLIFERFKQIESDSDAAKAGFGLGLHIASELARVNFSTLSVESEPQKGSTFAFTLPVFDVDLLIPLHLRFLKTSRHNFQRVSIAVASVPPGTEPEALAEVERFLSRQIRSYDLLLKLGDNWLACIACAEQDIAAMIERIELAYAEHNRNRPEGALPEIDFREIGTWMISDRHDGLSAAIRSAYALDHDVRGVH